MVGRFVSRVCSCPSAVDPGVCYQQQPGWGVLFRTDRLKKKKVSPFSLKRMVRVRILLWDSGSVGSSLGSV